MIQNPGVPDNKRAYLGTDSVRRQMTTRVHVIALVSCALAFGSGSSFAASTKVDTAILNKIRFQAPKSADDKNYLHVKNKATFVLSEAASNYLLVEIFSMYCPICQAQAPNVNDLFAAIEKDPSLKRKLRVVGVGIGNTPFEVEVFRKKYDVKFPLLPDDSFAVQKAFAERVRTPTFLVLKRLGADKLEVKGVHLGPIKDAMQFLKKIRNDESF
jgi:peroxiredoxin